MLNPVWPVPRRPRGGAPEGLVEEVVLQLAWRVSGSAPRREGRGLPVPSGAGRPGAADTGTRVPAQSPVLADLKIPPSIFSFPLTFLLPLLPSFFLLGRSFLATRGLFCSSPRGASYRLGGPKPCWAPCCSGTGWPLIQGPPAPLRLTSLKCQLTGVRNAGPD